MPLVRRILKQHIESTHSDIETPHERWVPSHRVQPKDLIIAPEKIDDARLGDLAIRHPKEYEAEVKKRVKDVKKALETEEDPTTIAALEQRLAKLVPDYGDRDATDVQEEDEDDEPEVFEPTEEQRAFLALSEKEAVEMIKAEEDPKRLAEWLEAEEEGGKPRRAVLKAFANTQK
jgi:hypothetical protein